ncbi:hypothetical protein QBC43DRAFT_350127 [Cladorrhinum sp. PSN259]|nr:hypothetical protein QBC43DRAFT_350127 [Cladorrhinum sp. PSN259]
MAKETAKYDPEVLNNEMAKIIEEYEPRVQWFILDRHIQGLSAKVIKAAVKKQWPSMKRASEGGYSVYLVASEMHIARLLKGQTQHVEEQVKRLKKEHSKQQVEEQVKRLKKEQRKQHVEEQVKQLKRERLEEERLKKERVEKERLEKERVEKERARRLETARSLLELGGRLDQGVPQQPPQGFGALSSPQVEETFEELHETDDEARVD